MTQTWKITLLVQKHFIEVKKSSLHDWEMFVFEQQIPMLLGYLPVVREH